MLSAPFGTGAGLTLDEICLLVQADNPYWGSEKFALLQGAVAALAAIALAIRFHYRGTAFLAEPAVKTALFEVPGAIA